MQLSEQQNQQRQLRLVSEARVRLARIVAGESRHNVYSPSLPFYARNSLFVNLKIDEQYNTDCELVALNSLGLK